MRQRPSFSLFRSDQPFAQIVGKLSAGRLVLAQRAAHSRAALTGRCFEYAELVAFRFRAVAPHVPARNKIGPVVLRLVDQEHRCASVDVCASKCGGIHRFDRSCIYFVAMLDAASAANAVKSFAFVLGEKVGIERVHRKADQLKLFSELVHHFDLSGGRCSHRLVLRCVETVIADRNK